MGGRHKQKELDCIAWLFDNHGFECVDQAGGFELMLL